jgi:hypothetical protein
MLQLGQQNEISDYFCTCDEAEKMGSCSHLSAATRRIFLGKETPLHERYEGSLWRYLLQIAARHLGFDQKLLHIEESQVSGKSPEGDIYFTFIAKNKEGEEKLGEFFQRRSEDQSFKMSGLSTEELSSYRAGRPTFFTRFELSFWADIAKWLLNLYETKEKIEIEKAMEKKERRRGRMRLNKLTSTQRSALNAILMSRYFLTFFPLVFFSSSFPSIKAYI